MGDLLKRRVRRLVVASVDPPLNPVAHDLLRCRQCAPTREQRGKILRINNAIAIHIRGKRGARHAF